MPLLEYNQKDHSSDAYPVSLRAFAIFAATYVSNSKGPQVPYFRNVGSGGVMFRCAKMRVRCGESDSLLRISLPKKLPSLGFNAPLLHRHAHDGVMSSMVSPSQPQG